MSAVVREASPQEIVRLGCGYLLRRGCANGYAQPAEYIALLLFLAGDPISKKTLNKPRDYNN